MIKLITASIAILICTACAPLDVPGTWINLPSESNESVAEDSSDFDCARHGNRICGPVRAFRTDDSFWMIQDATDRFIAKVSDEQIEMNQGYMEVYMFSDTRDLNTLICVINPDNIHS
jgi:hypothetical protein